MGEVMIRCPKTGKPVTTGIYIERARFRSMPVSSVARFVRRAPPRTSGSPGTHGSATRVQRFVIRIAIAGRLARR
jgi:hypothetical protein